MAALIAAPAYMLTTNLESGNVLKIAGVLDINVADELRTTFIDLLEREPSLTLDLSAVEECDTAGLQLLLSLHKSAVRREKPVHIVALSANVTETAAALGLNFEELTAGPIPPVA